MPTSAYHTWPHYTQSEAEIIKQVLLSNKVNYWTGTETRKFEIEFKHTIRCRYTIAVSNHDAAFDLALLGLDIQSGDEVILSPLTDFYSINSLVAIGATPIFADVCPQTNNITHETVAEVISAQTKAVVCLHYAGLPCDMDPILDLAFSKNLSVVEDCSQALGAQYKGHPVGSLGDISYFSFSDDAIVTTAGEGGMVATNKFQFWDRMRAHKDGGKSFDKMTYLMPINDKLVHDRFGTNLRMTELQGAIGRLQLKNIKRWNVKRNAYLTSIWKTVSAIDGLFAPLDSHSSNVLAGDLQDQIIHGGYKCIVLVDPLTLNPGWDRDAIVEELQELGVPCYSAKYEEVYHQTAVKEARLCPAEILHGAQYFSEHGILFDVHPALSIKDVDKICRDIKAIMQYASGQKNQQSRG